MSSALQKTLTALRGSFIGLLNVIPYLKLSISELEIYVLPDGFGSLEENILKTCSVYFSPSEIAKAKTIIDLGAHHGSFSIYAIYNSQPYTRIIAVEPMPKAYKMLVNNILLAKSIVHRKKLVVIPLNAAIWKEKTTANLVITRWSEASYVMTTNSKESSKIRSVQTVTMDEILDKATRPVIVKMDIEGAEYALFEKPQWLEKIDSISIEVHGSVKEIESCLVRYGFSTSIKEVVISSGLIKEWLKVKPRWYGLVIGCYRLIVSKICKPTIKIIKARRDT